MKIVVFEKARELGILNETDAGNITFEYNDDVVPDDYMPSMVEKKNIFGRELPHVFEALLPEDGKIDIIRAQHDISHKIGIFLYLEGIQGSFEFVKFEDKDSYIPKKTDKIIYQDDKKEILNNDYLFPNELNFKLDIDEDTLSKYEKHNVTAMGLSGYQNKLGVSIDFANGIITHDDASPYFMKPYKKEYVEYDFKTRGAQDYIPYISINEHLFMTMARDIGLDVPWSALIRGDKDYHYIVKRFDRNQNGSLDHFDSAVLLGILSEKKYDTTYEKVFDALNEKISHEEMIKAYKFLVYSVIIAHGDLHAKNISIIRSHNMPGKKFENFLSPLYDVSTTAIYKFVNDKQIGLKIDGKNKNIRRKTLVDFAKRYKIEKDLADKIIDEVVDFFVNDFKKYVDLLTGSMQSLQFHESKYSSKNLKVILYKYYDKRVRYIDQNIKKVTKDVKDIF